MRRILVLDAGSRCRGVSLLRTPHGSCRVTPACSHVHKCTHWIPIRITPRGDVLRTRICECSSRSPYLDNAVIAQEISGEADNEASNAITSIYVYMRKANCYLAHPFILYSFFGRGV